MLGNISPLAERRTTPVPVIVMAHGFGSDKTMGLAYYAEAFAAAGYGCIVFDYRRWGASDGTPRYVLIVKDQLEDYRTAIKYARLQPEFDPQRLILWGSSFSGAHSITLSSDATVNAVAAMAQCPYTGVSPPLPLDFTYLKMAGFALLDMVKQALGLTPAYIPVISEPKTLGALTTEGTKPGMLAICSKDNEYKNKVSASSLLQVPPYQPRAKAGSIKCPLLIVLPTEDNLCLPEGAVQISKATEKCELVSLPCGHFDLYHGMSHHTESLQAQLDFLKKHVPV
ncbi:Hydrolase-4 domain-containing protein [Mycena sanguinolenta]|uniref:Hydrolase-4 domain-containing protein n=1 Tax=Mycena sanguinolenta TaxID=230812 RepID=A0A8H7DJG9_9AGAR|nr:Hydrolase-4 domain-containing protein [Mycena sanguinolenta]